MPIRRFIDGEQFDRETLDAMSRAFLACCRKLRLADLDDPLNAVVASRVIELARGGTRDPNALYKLSIAHFKGMTE